MIVKKLTTAALGLAISSSALAVSTTTLTVSGTITPVACTPTLGNGGKVDYGKISVGDLTASSNTNLAVKTISFTVDCAGVAAPFALQATDNKAGSALVSTGDAYGLGNQGTTPIGYYTMRLAGADLEGDGDTVVGLNSTDRTTWTAAPTTGGTGPAIMHDGTLLGFAETASDTAVKPLANLTGTLEIRTVMAPTDTLAIASEVPFEGSATIDVIYL